MVGEFVVLIWCQLFDFGMNGKGDDLGKIDSWICLVLFVNYSLHDILVNITSKSGMDAIFFKNKNVAPKRSDLFSKPKCRFQNVRSFLKIKISLPKDRIFSNDQQKKIGHFCEMSDIFKWSDLLKWSDILKMSDILKRSTTISKLKLSSKTLFSYLTGSLLHNWPKSAYKF